MFASAPLPEIVEIQRRLGIIFPEGIADRTYVTRESTARTIFVMLYIDAVEGRGVNLAPQHVYRFTVQQCERQDVQDRAAFPINCRRKNYVPDGDRWYADNSREQIRDESIKDGLVSKGVVIIDPSVPATSNRGRYALRDHFAQLFLLPEEEFAERAAQWQTRYLSRAELARVRIMRGRHTEASVQVTLPNGERRHLAAGGSSVIAKAVIEEFATRFLVQPAILWISESDNHVVLQDDQLMRDLGLPIDQQRLLPDLVLADLGREHTLLIFVEIVYSDGPMTEARKAEILRMTAAAGFEERHIAFVSAFEQRNAAPLKKRFSGIAVDSLIWCMAEPDLLIWLGENQETPFTRLPLDRP